MRARRPMLEKMWSHYQAELGQLDHQVPGGETVRMFDPYWITTDKGKIVMSEDYSFCQRWRDLGGKVFMDVSIATAHLGTKAYAGRLGDFLAATEPKKDAA